MKYTDAGAMIKGEYRYLLWRRWRRPAVGEQSKVAVFVMLNPSTADGDVDDPTIRRCVRFAWDAGYDALSVVNLFALRATDPDALALHADPVGPDNALAIAEAVNDATTHEGIVVAAWGARTRPRERDRAATVLAFLQQHFVVYALGLTAHGDPRHPLYAPLTARPFLYRQKKIEGGGP